MAGMKKQRLSSAQLADCKYRNRDYGHASISVRSNSGVGLNGNVLVFSRYSDHNVH